MHSTRFQNVAKAATHQWERKHLLGEDVPEQEMAQLNQEGNHTRDSLQALSVRWKSDEERQWWSQAVQQYNDLQAVLAQAPDSAQARAVFAERVQPALAGFQATMDLLFTRQNKEVQEADVAVKQVQSRLDWLVPTYVAFAFLLAYAIGYFMITGVLSRIRFLKKHLRKLGEGNLPETIPPVADEMNVIIREINTLTDNLRQIKDFALYVGKGDFDKNISVFDDQGDLGGSLSQMRNELRKVSEEEKRRAWANEGFASMSDILRGSTNRNELTDRALQHLIKYLNANQGGLFMIENEGTPEAHLQLAACYAYNRKKHQQREIRPGQGLLGQAWLEGETTYLREIPEDYLRITSGLGDANPRYLLLVPLKIEDRVEGVIELASFRDFEPHMIRFVERVAESIASVLANAKVVERTHRLLAESQDMTELMKAQEEEMRQNMEELAATQEEMQRKEQATARQRLILETMVNHADYASVTIGSDYRIAALNDRMRKYYAGFGVTIEPGMQAIDELRKYFGEAEAQRRQGWYDRALAGESHTVMETIPVGKQTVYVESHHRPIRDEQGRITAIVVTGRDVSAFKQREAELEKTLQEIRAENETLAQQLEELKARQTEQPQ
jgi:methyl-accepting chemotaxis protein